MASPREYSDAFQKHRNPKRFPLHYDGWQFYPDYGAAQEALDATWTAGIAEVVEELGDKPFRLPKYKSLYRKIRARHDDPIVYYAILNMLVQCQRGLYIRSSYLQTLLNQQYPQYVFSVSMIGRVLGGLSSHVAQMYPEVDEAEVPFARGRDTRGFYWVVDPVGSEEGLLWLIRARDLFMYECEALMKREAAMSVESLENSLYVVNKPEDVFDLICSFRIRSPENYRASWRPDSLLGPSASARKPAQSPYSG